MRKGIGGLLLLGVIGLAALSFGSQPEGPSQANSTLRSSWEY